MTGRGTPDPVVTPSGFFVLRTPLLPFTEITAWGDGLQAPAAAGDPGVLGEAVAADRAQLRRRLEDIVTTPEFRDALFVASPGLAAAADLWRKEPDRDKGRDTGPAADPRPGPRRRPARHPGRRAGRRRHHPRRRR